MISSLYFLSFPCKVTWRDVAGLDEIISELARHCHLAFPETSPVWCFQTLAASQSEDTEKAFDITVLLDFVVFPSYSCCTLGLHDKSCFNRDHDHCFSQLNRHNHLQYLPSGLFILIIYALFLHL